MSRRRFIAGLVAVGACAALPFGHGKSKRVFRLAENVEFGRTISNLHQGWNSCVIYSSRNIDVPKVNISDNFEEIQLEDVNKKDLVYIETDFRSDTYNLFLVSGMIPDGIIGKASMIFRVKDMA